MLNIEKNDLRIQRLHEIENKIKKNPMSCMYIWGCSQTAQMITDFVGTNSNIEISGYVVDDKFYSDTTFCNKPIYKASKWHKEVKNGDFVIMGFVDYHHARNMISMLPTGVTGLYFSFPYSANAYGDYLTYAFYRDKQDEFNKVYQMLEDEISRNTMEAFLNACISGKIDRLEELQMAGQYFNSLTQDYKIECFVDCGAYIGDTIEEAFKFYPNTLNKIVAFEPDITNLALLKDRMMEKGISENQLCLNAKGTWSKEDVLFFSSTGSSSNIIQDGDIKIEVDAIDNIMSDLNKKADFIKMDVEGSEKASLIGADTIKKYHPLLAVCVYHKPEDLYDLTNTIIEIVEEDCYRYYLRYHGPDLRELVLYAVPKC